MVNPVFGEWTGRAGQVRAQVTEPGNLQTLVAFQNDVNALVASVDSLESRRPSIPSGIQAAHGILPGRVQKNTRVMRVRLRGLIAPRRILHGSGPVRTVL